MKNPEFLKFSTIKNYIKEKQKIRSTNDAVEHLCNTISDITLQILKQAEIYSHQDKRKTIMIEDIKKAIEKVIGKRHLGWEDVFQHIKKLSPAGIGNLSAALEIYIKEEG